MSMYVIWIVIGLCLLMAVFYLTAVFPTKWLKVERVRIPLGTGLKILQISDLHVERNRIRPRVLAAVIQRERPDFICLTGDYLDKDSSFVLLAPFLKMIQNTQVPAYAVLGNHDYLLTRPAELKHLLNEFGITVLDNQTARLDKINLVGIDDFDSDHSDEAAAFQSVEKGKPIVVMTHDPTITLYMKQRFDYLFAGHLHGKQFNIPFLFQLKNMGPLAASGVYKGVHQNELGTFYISKGVGQSGYNFRFLVRSEITVHEL